MYDITHDDRLHNMWWPFTWFKEQNNNDHDDASRGDAGSWGEHNHDDFGGWGELDDGDDKGKQTKHAKSSTSTSMEELEQMLAAMESGEEAKAQVG